MQHNATNAWIPVLLFSVDVSDAGVSLELTSTHLVGQAVSSFKRSLKTFCWSRWRVESITDL